MTKEVALTRLDLLVDSILGHASLQHFIAQNPCRVLFTHIVDLDEMSQYKKSRTIHIDIICLFVCLFDLMRYVTVNNFSVMLG